MWAPFRILHLPSHLLIPNLIKLLVLFRRGALSQLTLQKGSLSPSCASVQSERVPGSVLTPGPYCPPFSTTRSSPLAAVPEGLASSLPPQVGSPYLKNFEA